MQKLLMGNEAIGLAAIHAGVNVVCGYPGTPSTEVLETVAKLNDGKIHVEWSVNEKVAVEVAAGASYSGARTMVTMKQVGLNVATDPIMSLAYVGVKGGMIVLVADDPGPISSQTEQDTRRFGEYSKIPVLDPSSVQEAYDMVEAAFELSEKMEIPVILRPTTRVCHARSTIKLAETVKTNTPAGFEKDPKWVIFPRLSYENHKKLDRIERELQEEFCSSPFNSMSGTGKKGIVTSGVCFSYVSEVLSDLNVELPLLKVGTPYPFPIGLAETFLKGLDQVLVIEELDSVLEDSLLKFCRAGGVKISGRRDRTTAAAGEYSYELISKWVRAFLGLPAQKEEKPPAGMPALPQRPPVLCAGCPHRAAFYSVKQAMKWRNAVFCGDIGCYTLGNAKPLDMVDTCLCMGADITIAQGLAIAEPDVAHFSFIGDSTFFHTGIPGVINAVYNNTKITVIVLDNGTTAMTGHQPHPGTGKTAGGDIAQKISIEEVLKACGVGQIETVDPLDLEASIAAVKRASDYDGVSAVVFRAPCITLFKPPKTYRIMDNCLKCRKCVAEIGCPALFMQGDAVRIDPSLCYGCGLCAKICPVKAIGGEL